MTEPKYCLHPGRVRSSYDGQIHHIGFRQLVSCYGLDPRQCIVADDRFHHPEGGGYICLWPRVGGDYVERLKHILDGEKRD